jgi:hypothetical protein
MTAERFRWLVRFSMIQRVFRFTRGFRHWITVERRPA